MCACAVLLLVRGHRPIELASFRPSILVPKLEYISSSTNLANCWVTHVGVKPTVEIVIALFESVAACNCSIKESAYRISQAVGGSSVLSWLIL